MPVFGFLINQARQALAASAVPQTLKGNRQQAKSMELDRVERRPVAKHQKQRAPILRWFLMVSLADEVGGTARIPQQ